MPSPLPGTTRSRSGIWRPARNCARSPATPTGSMAWPSSGRAARRLRFLGQHAQGVGSGDRPGTAHPRRPLRPGSHGVAVTPGRAACRLRFLGQTLKVGIWRPVRNCARSKATPTLFMAWRSPGRAYARLRFVGQDAQSVGSGDRREYRNLHWRFRPIMLCIRMQTHRPRRRCQGTRSLSGSGTAPKRLIWLIASFPCHRTCIAKRFCVKTTAVSAEIQSGPRQDLLEEGHKRPVLLH